MDNNQLTYIYSRYYKLLLFHANNIVKNKTIAEDVVQDIFVELCTQHESQAKDEIALKNYLYKSVFNRSIDYTRSGHYQSLSLEDEELMEIVQNILITEDDHYGHELKREIKKILNTLPKQTKLIFLLSREKGMKNKDIAQHLNITTKTVEKHMGRALNQIKDQLNDNGYLTLLIIMFYLNQKQ